MAELVSLGDRVINLDQVVRVEWSDNKRTSLQIWMVRDDPREEEGPAVTLYEKQAEAAWAAFEGMAKLLWSV